LTEKAGPEGLNGVVDGRDGVCKLILGQQALQSCRIRLVKRRMQTLKAEMKIDITSRPVVRGKRISTLHIARKIKAHCAFSVQYPDANTSGRDLNNLESSKKAKWSEVVENHL